MKTEQIQWTEGGKWSAKGSLGDKANLVFVFGERALINQHFCLSEIKSFYPKAHIMGCSTAGEIYGDRVADNSLSVAAIQLEKTSIKQASVKVSETKDSYDAGKKLAALFDGKDLTHLMVLSIGLGVNGSDLVQGLTEVLPKTTTLTGGMAGDQDRFQETLVVLDDSVSNDEIVAIGFYGNHLKVNSASLGGWDTFGSQKTVTRSAANVLYELDGKSALEMYKTLLGDQAKALPGSALLFPLSLQVANSDQGIVRTILSVDESEQSMTFAGDIPMDSKVRFMKANFDRLIEGAETAAQNTILKKQSPAFAVLISCVGRKLVLKSRVNEEVLGVRKVFGPNTLLTGFYSYGEISPFTPGAKCELHNQTMTITTFSED